MAFLNSPLFVPSPFLSAPSFPPITLIFAAFNRYLKPILVSAPSQEITMSGLFGCGCSAGQVDSLLTPAAELKNRMGLQSGLESAVVDSFSVFQCQQSKWEVFLPSHSLPFLSCLSFHCTILERAFWGTGRWSKLLFYLWKEKQVQLWFLCPPPALSTSIAHLLLMNDLTLCWVLFWALSALEERVGVKLPVCEPYRHGYAAVCHWGTHWFSVRSLGLDSRKEANPAYSWASAGRQGWIQMHLSTQCCYWSF